MDYKKKYKQLHTLISDLYPFMSEYCKEKVEGFFPELAGSKDERIRKALLEMVHDTTGDELWVDYNVHKEEALSWLEKQESVNEIVSRCRTSWYNEGKIAGMAEGLTDDEKYQQGWHDALEKQGESYTKRDVDDAWLKGMCDAKREFEKQGDKLQKTSIWKHWKDGIAGNGEGEPIYLVKNGNTYSLNSCLGYECDYIELSELDKLMLEKQGETYTKRDVDNAYLEGMAFAKDELEKQGEQKPIEWDADDEEKLYFLKARLKDYEDCIIYDEELSMCQKNNVRETTKEFLEWLDSIKERIGG